jgi:hypothetical protein
MVPNRSHIWQEMCHENEMCRASFEKGRPLSYEPHKLVYLYKADCGHHDTY